MKIAAMRAGKLSTRPICTEFRPESNRGVGFSLRKLAKYKKSKKVNENSRRESWEALDHTILHRISVRIQPQGRLFASSHLGKRDFLCFPTDFTGGWVDGWRPDHALDVGPLKKQALTRSMLISKQPYP